MIKTEMIGVNALKITAPEKLEASDFQQLAPQVDGIIQQQGKIKLLADVSAFRGWHDLDALKEHFEFVKSHHHSAERAAIITGPAWQRGVASIAKLFLHPEVHIYTKNQEAEARQWIS